MRPIVDRKVLEFVQSHTLHPADFTIRNDGVCRLSPEMAKCVFRIVEDSLEMARTNHKMELVLSGSSLLPKKRRSRLYSYCN
jgi:hypothetical protein